MYQIFLIQIAFQSFERVENFCIFVISNNKSFISQNFKIVGLLLLITNMQKFSSLLFGYKVIAKK